MAPIALEPEDHTRDAAFAKAMHGKSAEGQGFTAMLKKDPNAQKAAVEQYFKHWDGKPADSETAEVREMRKAEYATLTKHYYNLATDLYEYGWGSSFHFCRYAYGEPFYQALARHEHYLAAKIGISDGMKVLDVGCGVGGPAREIAKFTGANITGLNNNDYQIERATKYAAKEGLSNQLNFIKGDFMQMSFPENNFDAVYAIEATCHAPSLEGVYSQIYRVLKPGGTFGVYEWVMTDAYDNDNPAHRKIRLDIEQGNAISNMVRVSDAIAAMKAAGFKLEIAEDMAARPDFRPWYYPLAGDFSMIGSLWDIPTIARMHKYGRGASHRLIGMLERFGLAPKGTQKTADSLALGADGLVAGGKAKLFTPMLLMVGKKPASS